MSVELLINFKVIMYVYVRMKKKVDKKLFVRYY